MDIFAEKCLKLKNAGILCRIFVCLRLNLCVRIRKKLAYGQIKNKISGADVCQVRKREWLNELLRVCQVYAAPMSVRAQARMAQAGQRAPFPRQCRMLMSSFPTEAFGVRVSACRALDYGECALFRKRNLFMHCLPLLLYAFLCSVTLARGRVCVYILCLFSDIYVRRPKAAGVLSGSFMRLSRAACAKCRG